jgi:SNF2 family DNA or RNA helicase
MMKFLRPDILGDLADKRYFATKYAKPIAAGMASDATKRCVYDSLNLAQELHDFFAPHVQRVGSSVLEKDLPPIQHVVLNVRQTRIQTSMYTAHKKSVTEATRHMRKKTSFFKYYNTLRPINSHPASLLHRTDDRVRGEDDDEDFDIDDEGWYDTTVNKEGEEKVNEVMNGYKIALLLHLLAAAEEEGEKVVVFANSLATLNYIEFALELDWVDQVPSLAASFPEKKGTCWEQSVDYFRIDGSASAKQRGEIIQEFQESETAKAMLLSRAGGIGINLVRLPLCATRSRIVPAQTRSTYISYRLDGSLGVSDKRQSCGYH